MSQATLTPGEQLAKDVEDLYAKRDALYIQFKEIEDTLEEKKKLIQALELIKDSPTLQQSLVSQMRSMGLITK